jgi:hypothetical protein
MVSSLKYDYSELTKYFKGIFNFNLQEIDFEIIESLQNDGEKLERIDLMIVLNYHQTKKLSVQDTDLIKDAILIEFNKKFV